MFLSPFSSVEQSTYFSSHFSFFSISLHFTLILLKNTYEILGRQRYRVSSDKGVDTRTQLRSSLGAFREALQVIKGMRGGGLWVWFLALVNSFFVRKIILFLIYFPPTLLSSVTWSNRGVVWEVLHVNEKGFT